MVGRRSASLAVLVLALRAAATFAAPDPAPRDVVIDWHVPITMRDGTRLNANIYHPPGVTRLPAVLTITPYTIDTLHKVGNFFARHGYVYVAVDTRGRGGSQGALLPTTHEAEDGVDTIDWIARQNFSDGRVVMWGGSYAGRNQLVIATRQPPALKAITPASAGYYGIDRGMRANIPFPQQMTWMAQISGHAANRNAYTDRSYWLGAMAELAEGRTSFRHFDQLVGMPSALWQANLAHPTLDAYWQNTTGDASALTAQQLSAVTIPILAITADYDASQVGLRTFMKLHDGAVAPAALERNAMLMGPWAHEGTRMPTRMVGGIDFGPAAAIDILELERQWFDWVLGRGSKPAFLGDHFVYFLLGANEWRSAPSLDAATGGAQTFWLDSRDSPATSLAAHGWLSAQPKAQAPDAYVYDPSVPGRNEGIEGYDLVSPNYLTDADAVRRLNGEGLIYETPPLAKPMDLVGMPSAALWLAMDVPDTDIRVALYAVMADGTQIFLSQDQLRARYRHGLDHEELVRPGSIERYDFQRFDFVARRLPAGARLRLVISPLGLSIHQERNRNSGGVVADETAADNRVAHVKLMMGPELSRLQVPLAGPATAVAIEQTGLLHD